MKKKILIGAIIVLILNLMLPISVSAASASASLTGPGTVRAGDKITLSFNLNGNGIFGASGTLSYDSSQLTLSGISQKIGSPWAVEFNGNNFVAYDNNLSNPINGNKALFTATFQIKSVAPGTKINIFYTDVTASDGTTDANVGTVSYSATVAEPLSGANKLTGLTVSNATISPAFNADTTAYTAKVPFSISKLDIKTTAEDKATVSINNPNLIPSGTTTISITVTAENGAKKTYTIKVTREQDPNYKASNNNKLSDISIENFLLSPGFNADTTKYVVWLPYETEQIKVSGKAEDSKASVEVIGGDKLLAGQDNEVKVICTAEDGSKKEYIVIAKRATSHDGSVDEKPTTPTSVPTQSITTSSDIPADTEPDPASGGIPWWILLIVGGVCLGGGFAGGFVVKEKIHR